MNGLSVGELCCLFCCPPFPSHIVAKLAFLPPPPTYKLIINGDQTVYTNSVSNSPHDPTNEQSNGTVTTTQQAIVNNRNSNREGGLWQTLRNSGRLFCRSIVCSQRYHQSQQSQQNGQLLQQLHTNAKIVMLEKAEWQVK